MQIYLQLNDIKQHLDQDHFENFLEFIKTQNQKFIISGDLKILEDKIIIWKDNDYIKLKDNALLNYLNEYINFASQNPNANFNEKEIQFLENLGIFPTKIQYHYEVFNKLNQLQNLGIKINFPSEFLSKQLKFPVIELNQLLKKPLSEHLLIAYSNHYNEIYYTSKLYPFDLGHLKPFENTKNLDLYLRYITSKIENSKTINESDKEKAYELLEDLKSLYLVPNHKKDRLIFNENDVYLKPSDLFDNYLHQRFVNIQQKRVYDTITHQDENELYYLNQFVSLLNTNLSDYVDSDFTEPQRKYREVVIKTINEYRDKKELSKDTHLQQFLKLQLNLDISVLEKQKDINMKYE